VVAASYGGAPVHPAWYHNLVADPRVRLQDGVQRLRVLAREATAAERAPVWEAADAVWPDFASYRRSATPREIPLVLLHSS
jgi:deazaflavin-dependent oxidoreductase (nitroreductase family)